DQLPGADRADAFQWPERWCDARRLRSLQALDPSWERTPKLLDLALVLDKPWIVRHTLTPLVSALDKLEFRAGTLEQRHCCHVRVWSKRRFEREPPIPIYHRTYRRVVRQLCRFDAVIVGANINPGDVHNALFFFYRGQEPVARNWRSPEASKK